MIVIYQLGFKPVVALPDAGDTTARGGIRVARRLLPEELSSAPFNLLFDKAGPEFVPLSPSFLKYVHQVLSVLSEEL